MKAINPKIAKSFFSKSTGLMFQKPKPLLLEFSKEQKISLHTFFMLEAIDVFFLNKNKRIVEIKRNLRPYRLYTSKKEAMYAFETPCTYVKAGMGSKIEF